MTVDQPIMFDEIASASGHLGVMTLNRPQVLNALNDIMVLAMLAKLKEWASAQHIKAVIIRAVEGRAFCAGGDIRFTYERAKEKNPHMTDFFAVEYELNRLIFHFPKPYIALLDGITMGGGAGISINGSHRVATERLLFAMPETSIGFFPDVGGTYFLPRLPGYSGFYLGLTGARLKADDCVALSIAQHRMQHVAVPNLLDALTEEAFGDDAFASVTHIINQFREKITPEFLPEHQAVVDACFSLHTMEDIVRALRQRGDKFSAETLDVLSKKSPTSLKVTLRALQLGKELDFDACMQQETRLAKNFLLGHDFVEGIRAVIVDKDQKPVWQPDALDAVRDEVVESYFV